MDGSIVCSIDRLKYQAASQPGNQLSSPPVRPSVAGFLNCLWNRDSQDVSEWICKGVTSGRMAGHHYLSSRSVGQARITANIRPFPRLACNFFFAKFILYCLAVEQKPERISTSTYLRLMPSFSSILLITSLSGIRIVWKRLRNKFGYKNGSLLIWSDDTENYK